MQYFSVCAFFFAKKNQSLKKKKIKKMHQEPEDLLEVVEYAEEIK